MAGANVPILDMGRLRARRKKYLSQAMQLAEPRVEYSLILSQMLS